MTSRYLGVSDAGLQRALQSFQAARGIMRTCFGHDGETADQNPAIVETETPSTQGEQVFGAVGVYATIVVLV
jgi:hypothetical protein